MNEEEFREWLRKEKYTDAAISSYPKALKNSIPNELYNRGENKYKNLFDCNDMQYINELYKRCSKNEDLHQFNTGKNGFPSASLQQYSKFLKYCCKEALGNPFLPVLN
jgi:5-methylcytosine-specific restriction protein B